MELARCVASRENPLTARVFVNRLWKIAFGQGLVKTVEDFGAQGTPPTHPDLLDWLRLEFSTPDEGEKTQAATPPLRNGGQGGSETVRPWDIKRMLTMMVMS